MESIHNGHKSVPVLLLTGYLGSGKTTLLNRILNNRRGIRFAVIVNDIGEVNIDAELIQQGGVVGNDGGDDLVALQNGCICCTLKVDLVKQLSELCASERFDYIVIEASGICEPAPIAQTIATMQAMAGEHHIDLPRLDCIVTVVDALRLEDEFAGGDALSRPDLDEEDIENLIIQQIEFCDIILLNKIDEVTPEQARHLRAVVRAIQPKARIIDCNYCDVDLDSLLYTNLFDFENVATSATWVSELEKAPTAEEEARAHDHYEHQHEHQHEHEHGHHHEQDHDHEPGCSCGHCHHHHDHEHGEAEEYGISTFVYYRRGGFDLNRFDYFVGKHWPRNIIRTKGVVYFKDNPDMSYLFEQAGKQKSLTQAGQWFATAPAEELEYFKQTEAGLARDWDPEYGDRMIKLVIIGRDLDREAIEKALDECRR